MERATARVTNAFYRVVLASLWLRWAALMWRWPDRLLAALAAVPAGLVGVVLIAPVTAARLAMIFYPPTVVVAWLPLTVLIWALAPIEVLWTALCIVANRPMKVLEQRAVLEVFGSHPCVFSAPDGPAGGLRGQEE